MEPQGSQTGRAVHAAVGLDDAYVMPLAAMVRSALDSLRSGWSVELHVLDAGISDANRRRLERSWAGSPIRVHYCKPDLGRFAGFPAMQGAGRATLAPYSRLLVAEFAPQDLERIVYLDCDMIVRRDLVELWEAPFHGNACLAVQDPGTPVFDRSAAPGASEVRVFPFLEDCVVPNRRELGLDGALPYFNGGMFVVDLGFWRRERLAERFLEALHVHAAHVTYFDQYPLNVVLAGRWGKLDPRWNRSSGLLHVPPERFDDPLYTRVEWERLLADPWIHHFIHARKPWEEGPAAADAGFFFAALDRTDWKGWRPRRSWGEWWGRRRAGLRRTASKLLGRTRGARPSPARSRGSSRP